MKYYCQLLTLSSGYVPNSTPPRFEESLKQVKEMLGSDAILILDARNSLYTMMQDSGKKLKSIQKLKPNVVGFRIVKSSSFINTDIQENKQYVVIECTNEIAVGK